MVNLYLSDAIRMGDVSVVDNGSRGSSMILNKLVHSNITEKVKNLVTFIIVLHEINIEVPNLSM